VVFEHVDPMLRVKRSRASAPHRREPPGTGDALRMKSGHESETTRAGHNVRRVASVQFSAPHVDIRVKKLQETSSPPLLLSRVADHAATAPPRTPSMIVVRRRAVMSINAMVSSATASWLTPGVLHTRIPRASAAATSIES
jgi:hypothetical protein